MRYRWIRQIGAPTIPEGAPVPQEPDELHASPREDAVWWHNGAGWRALYVTFTGDGTPPRDAQDPGRLFRAWLYLVPTSTTASARYPTFEEIYSALAQCPLEGVLWELPPFHADERPELTLEGRSVVFVQARQKGAIQGTPAHHRFMLALPGDASVISPAQG